MKSEAEVAVIKDTDIRRRTLEALKSIGGIDKVVGRGDKVFLKPNLVDGAPFESGEVVQLETMEVLVKEAFRAGAAEVVIGEVPTWKIKTKTVEAYEHQAKTLGAKFLDLSQHPFVEAKVENPAFFRSVKLSKPFLDSDVFVNVPTLKTHAHYGITIAIKNVYGLISAEDRILYHKLDRVEEAIIDLYQIRKADLTVVDGTYTTLHCGPRPLDDFKETFRLDLTLAGFDPVAIDTVGARILGIDPKTLRYLEWSVERKFGTNNLSKIKILGTSMEKAYFGKAVDVVKFFNSKRRNIKVLNYGACTGCLGLLNRIQRLNDSELRNELILVMGPDANVASVEQDAEGKKVILCGYCAAPTFYNELQGEPLLGCPPPPTVLANKIKELSGLS